MPTVEVPEDVLKSMAEDAMRWRWLRSFVLRWGWWPESLNGWRNKGALTAEAWDAAADAAMPHSMLNGFRSAGTRTATEMEAITRSIGRDGAF